MKDASKKALAFVKMASKAPDLSFEIEPEIGEIFHKLTSEGQLIFLAYREGYEAHRRSVQRVKPGLKKGHH